MKDKIIKVSLIIITTLILNIYFIDINNLSKKQSSSEIYITTPTTTSDIKTTFDDKTTSTKQTTNKTINNELEEYIKSVVACEMPALYNEEALKAQAIASRTYTLYENSNSKSTLKKDGQCSLTTDQMKDKWGDKINEYYKLISDAVDNTNNLVMKKNNQLFKSYYFSTSNGYTESSLAVFGEGDLVSVESSWDKTSKTFEVTENYTKDELIQKLGSFDNITITKRSKTNHVEEVMLDNKIMTGIKIRQLLNLRSTDFTINIIDNTYSITTYGYGHGVGMSQYGANELAKQGKNYSEILKYYYGNIEITTS